MMTTESSMWVGKDEHGGVPSQARSDLTPPAHWRLEGVAATERPHHLAISADRSNLAFVLDRDSSDIWSLSLDDGVPRRLTVGRVPHAYWADTTPVWSPDGSRLAYVDEGTVCLVTAAGGPVRRLVEAGDPHWLDEQHLVVTVDRDRRSRLARLDVDDPWPQPFGPGDGDVGEFHLAPDRSWAAFTFYPAADLNRSEIWRVELATGESRPLTGTPRLHDHSPTVSPDGASIVFASERSGWNELHVMASDGSGERQLTNDHADFSEATWHPEGSTIAASRLRSGVVDLVTVDAASGEVELLAAGGTWANPMWTADGRLVALHEGQRTPPRLVVVRPDGYITTLFQQAPAQVTAAPHISPEAVSYKSFDGLEIPGFLFRPTMAAADHKVAAVVYPHGGPTSYYGDEWDGHAQYFLDKGYAWLAINFRGSTGYGIEFERANHGVWGVKDTEDCLAAADYLASLDWVDARRIAIFGASYGSYMALCSLAMDPEHRYACGVLKYGDCDILTSWAQGDRTGADDLERMMGHPRENPDAYRAGSPIHHLDQVQRPMLIAHGERDDRVHPKQSEELVERLQQLGKTYEYITYPTEGHGLLRTGPQVHFYRRLERFLDWYLM